MKKKCAELLSMALHGRTIRNEVLTKIMSLLWHGLVDEVIIYISSLSKDKIRNEKEINNIKNYIVTNPENWRKDKLFNKDIL